MFSSTKETCASAKTKCTPPACSLANAPLILGGPAMEEPQKLTLAAKHVGVMGEFAVLRSESCDRTVVVQQLSPSYVSMSRSSPTANVLLMPSVIIRRVISRP